MPSARPVPVFVLQPHALSLALADPAGGAAASWVTHPLAPGAYALGAGEDPGKPDGLDLDELAIAIRTCLGGHGGRVRRARLLLEGPLVRPLSLPIAFRPGDEELRTAVRTEAERYMIFAGAEVAVGFSAMREEAEKVGVVFAAMRLDVVQLLTTAFAAQRVQLDAIEPLAVALARALSSGWPPALEGAEPAGIAALAGRRLEITTWAGGRPAFWRSVPVDADALRREEPGAIAEAAMELQRTLVELPVRRWLVADLPPPLHDAFRARPGAVVEERGLGGPGGWTLEALRGAATGAARDLELDLRPPAEVKPRAFTDAQLAVLLAFGAVAAGLLATMLILDGRVRAARSALEAVQQETAVLQAQVLAGRQAGSSGAGWATAVRGSAVVGAVLDGLREATPADTWIVNAAVEPGAKAKLEGVSLSYASPFAFAKALAAWPELADVGMPDLKRDTIAQRPVYRFTITARVLGPEGARRPGAEDAPAPAVPTPMATAPAGGVAP